MDATDKVIERIRKCLALAGSSNEAEALAALNTAQSLLVKYDLETTHGLTLDSIRRSHDTKDAIVKGGAMLTDAVVWAQLVGQGVGLMCNCQYFYTPVKIKGHNHFEHGYIGQRHSIAVARLMFDYLIKTVERIGDKALAERAPADIRKSYLHGCAYRLHERMKARAGEVNRGVATDVVSRGQLPMVINQRAAVRDQINQFITGHGGFLPQVARVESHDPAAFYAGAEAGDKIGLDPQVGEGPTTGALPSA